MEILIPGLILVALMAYVSTRIKRSAADAYERESIETDDFAVMKPEGFITIPSPDTDIIFAAYSKEYGTGDADRYRQVSVELRSHSKVSIDDVKRSLLESSELTDEQHLAGGMIILETRSASDEVEFENQYRLVAKVQTVYELRISALSETKESNKKNIDEVLSSFELK